MNMATLVTNTALFCWNNFRYRMIEHGLTSPISFAFLTEISFIASLKLQETGSSAILRTDLTTVNYFPYISNMQYFFFLADYTCTIFFKVLFSETTFMLFDIMKTNGAPLYSTIIHDPVSGTGNYLGWKIT